MPKVSHTTVTLDGVLTQFDIHYNKKEMFHVKNIPSEVIASTGFRTERYEREEDLCVALRNAIKHYHEIKASSRNIIAIKVVSCNDFIMNKVGEGLYQGRKNTIPKSLHYKIDSFGFGTKGFGFAIDYKRMKEVQENGLHYYEIKEDGSIAFKNNAFSPERHILIDYTPERWAFFEQLEASAEQMVVKIMQFLSDSERMVQMIDSGSVKLLSNGN